jgi:hypothetical protein
MFVRNLRDVELLHGRRGEVVADDAVIGIVVRGVPRGPVVVTVALFFRMLKGMMAAAMPVAVVRIALMMAAGGRMGAMSM